jgi:hypothetical protein
VSVLALVARNPPDSSSTVLFTASCEQLGGIH